MFYDVWYLTSSTNVSGVTGVSEDYSANVSDDSEDYSTIVSNSTKDSVLSMHYDEKITVRLRTFYEQKISGLILYV